MRLRELESFVAVAEELHFGRAAARLNLAQQPLSQNVRRLEERLGFALFTRTTRRVSLSTAGEVFLPSARTALRLLREGREAALKAEQGATGRLTVGVMDSALGRLLPPILRVFRQEHPEVSLDLRRDCSGELLAMLLAHELDVTVFVSGTSLEPAFAVPDGLYVREIAREAVAVALPPGHHLACQPTLALSALAEERWVMYAPGRKSTMREQMDGLCREAGFVPQAAQEADSEGLVLDLVAAGVGIALLPHGAGASHPDIVLRPLVAPEVQLITSVAWRAGGVGATLGAFLELLP